jgi:hypothetical protein
MQGEASVVLQRPVIPNFPKLKLETAKGSMVALPARILSQVISYTLAHLHCVARQGASLAAQLISAN